MTEREIREELLWISKDMAIYEFDELTREDKEYLQRAPISEVFKAVKSRVDSDVRGFYQEEYSKRLEKVEKALKDLWLLA